MLSDTTIKRLNTISEISLSGKKINGLFRLMGSPILWKQAYANLAPNKGAITKGIDDVTLDGFSEMRIKSLIGRIKSGNYHFKPVRRAYIPKKNGKMRPLGIPNGDDKLVQEVVRIILNQTYECCFSNNSHGFRENRSCHTALTQVKQTWTGAKWFIEMDIKGFFDNIDHDKMIEILEKKIDDKRFLKLIVSMLKAGYMEDWKFHGTYSGTPQGGVISPILANIYLNELDCFVNKLIREFNKGESRGINPEYRHVSSKIERLRMKYRKMEANASIEALEDLRKQIRELIKVREGIPYGSPVDANYKKLRYNRYADDFILGVIGSKQDAIEIADKIRSFVVNELHLEIAEDKFAISHASKGVDYLGYKVISYSGNKSLKLKVNGTYTLQRVTSERIQLIIPNEKLQKFGMKNGYGDMYHHKPNSRPMLCNVSDAEIIATYNAELRGIVNYYSIGNSANRKLEPLVSLARTSCAMTLAHKHKSTTSKVISSMKRPDGEWIRRIEGKDKIHEFRIYRLCTDGKVQRISYSNIDRMPNTHKFVYSHTELIQKLEANTCAVCGSHEKVEVHHIRRLKDVAGSKEVWKVMMAARRRKTIPLCSKCHHLLHQGKLN